MNRYLPFFLIFALLVGCSDSSRHRFDKTMQIGDEIVGWLEEFHDVNGRYPDDLSELIPSCTNEIPQPEWGVREWQYRAFNTEHQFELRVDESDNFLADHYLVYSNASGRWSVSDY